MRFDRPLPATLPAAWLACVGAMLGSAGCEAVASRDNYLTGG